MGNVIDLTTKKQEQQPIAKLFDESMHRFTDDEWFKANVNQITEEITSSYGATDKSVMNWIIKGFTLALCHEYYDN